MQIAFLPRYCTLASSVSVALYFSFFRVTGRHHNITVLLAFLKCAKSHSSFVAQQNLWPHKVNSHGDGGRETVFTILNNRKVYRWDGLDRSDLKPFQCPKTNEVFPIWIMSNIILSFITKHCQCCHSNLSFQCLKHYAGTCSYHKCVVLFWGQPVPSISMAGRKVAITRDWT